MHAPYEPESLSFDAILRLDRALRQARQRVFGPDPLTDAQWALLTEIGASHGGMSYAALEAGLGQAMGQPLLLAALSQLQEAGLILGDAGEGEPLLSHLRVGPQGFARIDAVVGAALVIARRR